MLFAGYTGNCAMYLPIKKYELSEEEKKMLSLTIKKIDGRWHVIWEGRQDRLADFPLKREAEAYRKMMQF